MVGDAPRSAASWNTGLSAAREDMPRKRGTERGAVHYHLAAGGGAEPVA